MCISLTHCLLGFLETQKRLHFALDLSQSMTRGNGWDHRLDRMAEVAVLVMESLQGFEHKFTYVSQHHGNCLIEPNECT